MSEVHWILPPPGVLESVADPTAPHRRYRATVQAHADTPAALADALREAADRVEERETLGEWWHLSGGRDQGWHATGTEDPNATPESYRQALTEWLETRREAGE